MTAMTGWSGLARRSARRTFRDRREAGQVLARGVGGLPRAETTCWCSAWRAAACRSAGRSRPRCGRRSTSSWFASSGVPQWQELAMGALASGGGLVVNENLVRSLGISDEALRTTIDRETEELNRREQAYRGGRPPADPRARSRSSSTTGSPPAPACSPRCVRCVPQTPRRWWSRCRSGRRRRAASSAGEADDVVCAMMPPSFEAVGQVYSDFHQVIRRRSARTAGQADHRRRKRRLATRAGDQRVVAVFACDLVVGGLRPAASVVSASSSARCIFRIVGVEFGSSSAGAPDSSPPASPGNVPAARRRSAAPRRSRWRRCRPRRSAHCW